MDIKCRQFCDKCAGTGRNGLSREAAMRQVDQMPLGGVILPGQSSPPTYDHKVNQAMKCGYCENGYNEFWLDLNEVLSRGV